MDFMDNVGSIQLSFDNLISMICERVEISRNEISENYIKACVDQDHDTQLFQEISSFFPLDCFSSSCYMQSEKKMELLSSLIELIITNNKTIEEYGFKLKLYDYSETCSLVWKSNYFAYRCRTCCLSPTMSLCAHCFHAGNHEGHDFNKFRSQTGGVCDCGDPTVIKPTGNCRFHGEDKIKLRPDIPREISEPLKHLLPAYFCGLFSYLLDFCEDTDVNYNKLESLPALHFLQSLSSFGWVTQKAVADILIDEELYARYCKDQKERSSLIYIQKSLCIKPCFIMPENIPNKELKHRHFLDTLIFMTIKLRFPESLVTFLIGLFSIAHYKEVFMQSYIDHYTRMTTLLVTNVCSKRRDLQIGMKLVNQIAHISVQLFSGQNTALRMVRERNLHLLIVHCMLNIFYMCKEKIDKKGNWCVNVDSLFIKNNILWPLISDMSMIMSHKNIVDYVFSDEDFLHAWTKVLSSLQFMNLSRKKQGDHITFETMGFHHAYNLEMEISVNTLWNIWEHYCKTIDFDHSHIYLRACLQRMNEVLCEYGKICQNDTLTPKTSRLPLSFHIPLSRHCACMLSLLTNKDYRIDAIQKTSRETHLLLEKQLLKDFTIPSLRRWIEETSNILLASQEIMNGQWIRNGSPIRQSAYNYLHSKFSYSYVDLDIFTIQFCTSQCPPYFLLNSLLNDNSLLSGINLLEELSKVTKTDAAKSADETSQGFNSLSSPTRLTNCLYSWLSILTWILDVRNNIDYSEDELIEKEVISLLAVKNLKHSDFNSCLPLKYFTTEFNIKSVELDKILSKVAQFISPSCASSLGCVTSGTYSLKPEIWYKNFDFIFQTLRLNSKTDSAKFIKLYRTKIKEMFPKSDINGIWPNFILPRDLPATFENLNLILLSKNLLFICYILLNLFLHNNPLMNEENLAFVIQLLYRSVHVSTRLSYPLKTPSYFERVSEHFYERIRETNKMDTSNNDGKPTDNEKRKKTSLEENFIIDPVEYCRNFFNPGTTQLPLGPRQTNIENTETTEVTSASTDADNSSDDLPGTGGEDDVAEDNYPNINNFQNIIENFIANNDLDDVQRTNITAVTTRLRHFHGIFNNVLVTSKAKRNLSQVSSDEENLSVEYESPALSELILKNPYSWTVEDLDDLNETQDPNLPSSSNDFKGSQETGKNPIEKERRQFLNEISLERPITELMKEYLCIDSADFTKVSMVNSHDYNLFPINNRENTTVDSVVSILIKVHAHLYCSYRLEKDSMMKVKNLVNLGSVLVPDEETSKDLENNGPARLHYLACPVHLRFFAFQKPFFSLSEETNLSDEYRDGIYYLERLLTKMLSESEILKTCIEEYLEAANSLPTFVKASDGIEKMQVDKPPLDVKQDFKQMAEIQKKMMMQMMQNQKNSFMQCFQNSTKDEKSTVTGVSFDNSDDEIFSNTQSDTCNYFCVICQSKKLKQFKKKLDKEPTSEQDNEQMSMENLEVDSNQSLDDSFVMFGMISETNIQQAMRETPILPCMNLKKMNDFRYSKASQAIILPESYIVIPERSCFSNETSNDLVKDFIVPDDIEKELLKPRPLHSFETDMNPERLIVNAMSTNDRLLNVIDTLPFSSYTSFPGMEGEAKTISDHMLEPKNSLYFDNRGWWSCGGILSNSSKKIYKGLPLLKPGLILQTCGHVVHKECLNSYKSSMGSDTQHISCPLCRRIVHHVMPIFKKTLLDLNEQKQTDTRSRLEELSGKLLNLPDEGQDFSSDLDHKTDSARVNRKKIIDQLCGVHYQNVVILRSQLEAELSVLTICPDQYITFARRCHWDEFMKYISRLYVSKTDMCHLVNEVLGIQTDTSDHQLKVLLSDSIDIFLAITPYIWPNERLLDAWIKAIFCLSYSRQIISLLLNQIYQPDSPDTEPTIRKIPNASVKNQLLMLHKLLKDNQFFDEDPSSDASEEFILKIAGKLTTPKIEDVNSNNYLFGAYIIGNMLPFLRLVIITKARWQSPTLTNWADLLLSYKFSTTHLYNKPADFEIQLSRLDLNENTIDEFFALVKHLKIPSSDKINLGELTNEVLSIVKWTFNNVFSTPQSTLSDEALILKTTQDWITVLKSYNSTCSIYGPIMTTGRQLYPPRLYRLPKCFDVIFNQLHSIPCALKNHEFQENALCLICGKLICVSCSNIINNAIMEHSFCCSGFSGIMIEINSSIVFISMGIEVCKWGSVYLDTYGEEDHNLSRGKPLYLNEERLNLLEKQWITHSFRYVLSKWASS